MHRRKPSFERVSSRSSGSPGVPYPAAEPSGLREARRATDAEALRVVAQFRREALRPQRHGARHGLLHVGVARQRDRAFARGQRIECGGAAFRGRRQLAGGVE